MCSTADSPVLSTLFGLDGRPDPAAEGPPRPRGSTGEREAAIGAARRGDLEVAADEELRELADRVHRMLLEGELGTRSVWALTQMVESWEGKQLNGIASLRIGPTERGKVEAAFTSNATEVSTRWEFA